MSKTLAVICALTGEFLATAEEVSSGLKAHARKATKYDDQEAKPDLKAAQNLLTGTSMQDIFELVRGKKPTAETIKNKLVYFIASIGFGGVFRERYVAAIGMLGFQTLATKLGTVESLNKKRAVRVIQDGDKLIVDSPFSWPFNNALRGKGWTFHGTSDNPKAAMRNPYTAKSTGEIHQNVRVVDVARLPEVQQVLSQCYGGQTVILELEGSTKFDVL